MNGYICWRRSTQEFVHVNDKGTIDAAVAGEARVGDGILWMCQLTGTRFVSLALEDIE